ncbi:hypothetical protein ACOME3_000938 [Neoechinorhynchus agilis]
MVIGYVCWAWSISQLRLKDCRQFYNANFIETCFWSALFMFILIAVAVIWTPSSNNKRYAYAPLLDLRVDDDSSDEVDLTDIRIDEDDENMRRRQRDESMPVSKNVPLDPKEIPPTTTELYVNTE